MSVVLPVLGFLVLFVYMANSAGRSWRRSDEQRQVDLKCAEVDRRLVELERERAQLLAEEATLVTYDAVATRLPSNITDTIERTRP